MQKCECPASVQNHWCLNLCPLALKRYCKLNSKVSKVQEVLETVKETNSRITSCVGNTPFSLLLLLFLFVCLGVLLYQAYIPGMVQSICVIWKSKKWLWPIALSLQDSYFTFWGGRWMRIGVPVYNWLMNPDITKKLLLPGYNKAIFFYSNWST